VAIVVDASVGLKWVLQEPDSHLAEALVRSEPDLLVPDFWLNEATNVLWLQVRRKLFTPDEAQEGLALLRAQVEPTPTAHMRLHDLALDISIAIDHSTYDTLYLAFALAMGADAVVVADGPFLRSIRTHPDPSLSAMVLSLDAWARSQGGGASATE
jgi:predicted nucleic acid-binding protein